MNTESVGRGSALVLDILAIITTAVMRKIRDNLLRPLTCKVINIFIPFQRI